MLQPLQLEDVSQRYPEEIAEVRSFLGSAGVAVGSQQALAETAARLREDRGFRRDLTSYLWAALHEANGAMSSAQLLGVVAVAAAGTEFAAQASEADAHELLRFVMEARRSFGGAAAPSAMAQPQPLPQRPTSEASYGLPTAGLHSSPFKFEENSFSSLAAVEEQPDRRKLYAGIAAAACLLLVLLIGLLWHRSSGAAPAPATKAAVVQPVAPVAAPVVAPAAEPAVIHSGSAIRRAGREHAVSPRPALKAAVRAPAPQPAAAPVTRAAAPRAPVVAASNPASTPSLSASAPASAPVPADGLGPEDTEAIRLLRRPGDPKYTPDVATAIKGPFVHATSLGIMASHVTYGPAPAYPKAAVDAHVQGEVKVEADVNADGDVTSARVISGPPLLRDAATGAVQHWRYRPYLVDGNKPVGASATIVMEFQLP